MRLLPTKSPSASVTLPIKGNTQEVTVKSGVRLLEVLILGTTPGSPIQRFLQPRFRRQAGDERN